ncbi:bifunctional riboflavin kinase/FMN adenylyltransferase [Granulicella sp. 5B5]|uniref:bifunctional riboflavin kinase/FMN adenylyltransferase n=1 Tax=Granulicella sp. 5B5 TaxID=1617967 RepID=UPI0015F6E4BD|nr:bifunctional riboflavin kinase/FMN adenylyltransferase [Granulicella sp. 5B5]QMV17688.1 bifunctional riboflavin kinase/FMN adenylyltransferase [Granulicella sp. 5B5]
MKIARSLTELASFTQPSVVTIGNFDGVHCGHRMVIAAVRERAHQLGAASVAVTFDPHPAHVLRTDSRLPLITPLAAKLDLLAATGLDLTLVLGFTNELRHWTARHFATTVLHDTLHAAEVHEGETFRFGYDAEAGIDSLTTLGAELGFAVRAYEPRALRGSAISSSRIRKLIADGNMPEARALLGRPFSIHSTPASGRGYGTRYAVPTINLAPYADLLPAHGVYITTLRVGTGDNARLFHGVTNIGNRPTFGADSFAVETHLLDFEPIDLFEDTPLEMAFLLRLREERRFDSPELLRAQIMRDVAGAQRYFRLCDALHVRL